MSPRVLDNVAERWRRTPRRVKQLAAIFVVAFAVLFAIGLWASSGPNFYARYHVYQHNFATLKSSVHKGIPCDSCHVDSRGAIVHRVSLVADFYSSLVGGAYAPAFSAMPEPSRAACLACHNEDWSMDPRKTARVPHPAHLRVADEKRPCVVCHRWTAHEETIMVRHQSMPFSIVCASFPCHSGTKPMSACKDCHHVILQQAGVNWRAVHPATVRNTGANSCLEKCHVTAQCRQCHLTGVRPAFSKTGTFTPDVQALEIPHVKPDWIPGAHGAYALASGAKPCLTCHITNAECVACHSRRPPFHGSHSTWLNKHRSIAKKVDNPRCLTCHRKAWCLTCHKQFKEIR